MSQETKFYVGQKVKWCGVEGKVLDIYAGAGCLSVAFFGHRDFFQLDGRHRAFHTEPSLFPVEEKPKKTVTKWQAVVIDHTAGIRLSACLYDSPLEAKLDYENIFVSAIPITYEVEE